MRHSCVLNFVQTPASPQQGFCACCTFIDLDMTLNAAASYQVTPDGPGGLLRLFVPRSLFLGASNPGESPHIHMCVHMCVTCRRHMWVSHAAEPPFRHTGHFFFPEIISTKRGRNSSRVFDSPVEIQELTYDSGKKRQGHPRPDTISTTSRHHQHHHQV